MNWFIIALTASFLWALVNIVDQFLVSKYTNNRRSSGSLVLFSSLIGIVVSVFIGFFVPNIFDISLFDKLLLLISGFLTIIWIILYLYALRFESVSGIVPWFLTIPIFGYIISYLFLGEILNRTQQIGSIIILLGILVLTLDFSKKEKRNIHFKWKVPLYMIPASFLIAIIGIIFKYVAISENFWVSSFWVYIGLGISGIFIYLFSKSYRYEFLRMVNEAGVKIFTLNMTSEIISVLGNFLASYATLFAPIALVYIIGNFQPAILLILTLICTKFFPSIAIEDISKRVLIPKIISIVIIITGSIILLS